MKAKILTVTSLAFSLAACGGSAPPAESPEPEPAQQPETELESLPTDEEIAAEAEADARAEKLAQDRAQMQGQAQIELRRWTPELRAEVKPLAEASYPDLKSAVTAALAGAHRVPGNAERDAQRHPLETLTFFGLTPEMSVFEYGPGEGWYTEILAPTVAAQGKLLVNTADPDGPKENRQTYYAERLKLFLAKAPEVYGKVETVVVDPAKPSLDQTASLDMALVIRGAHGMVGNDTLTPWLQTIHAALKPEGILGIVQHRAPEGSDPKEWAKKGYLPEAWLIEQVKAQGFELVEKSEINANPKDTKDYADGVWTLPPNLRLGEKDRQKYIEIGESDRMTLRFKKPAAKE